MADFIKEKIPANDNMLSIEQLKAYPGFEHRSDAELMELSVFLKEYSLILYDVLVKSINKTTF